MKIKKLGSYALIIAALLGFAAYKGFFKTKTEKTSDNYTSKTQSAQKTQGTDIVGKLTETASEFVNDLVENFNGTTDEETAENTSIADELVEQVNSKVNETVNSKINETVSKVTGTDYNGSIKTVKLSDLPEKFAYTLDYVRNNDGYGPKNFYKRVPSEKNQFNNREGFDIDKNQIYQEYGVDPYVGPGQGTGNGDRLLVGSGGSVYVTRDHWKSLQKVIE